MCVHALVSMGVCVCVSEREKERDARKENGCARYVCVYVCMCMRR